MHGQQNIKEPTLCYLTFRDWQTNPCHW